MNEWFLFDRYDGKYIGVFLRMDDRTPQILWFIDEDGLLCSVPVNDVVFSRNREIPPKVTT